MPNVSEKTPLNNSGAVETNDDSPEFETLRIGWKVDQDNDMRPAVLHRFNAGAAIKREDVDNDLDMVRVAHGDMARHTAIVAQSGSGKSFFLGRLLEELATNAKARCLIFDPNGDFLDLKTVIAGTSEDHRNYPWEFESAATRLTHDEFESFTERWNDVVFLVKSQTDEGATVSLSFNGKEDKKLVPIRWPQLNPDLVAALIGAGLDGFAERGVRYCHEFVHRIWELRQSDDAMDYVSFAKEVAELPAEERGPRLHERIKDETGALPGLIDLSSHLDTPGRAVYFGEASLLKDSKLFAMNGAECAASVEAGAKLKEAVQGKSTLDVIDLPSAKSALIRDLMVGAFLQMEWDAATSSKKPKPWTTPRFVVVDEAHNLIPSDPPTESLGIIRDQFVRIAAEGRKYGLFLIVMTQRPDKVDPRVLSECENRLVMRLGSRAVLESAKHLLGLDLVPDDVLTQCTQFSVGRGLMVGKWSVSKKGYNFVYGAARRTEGAAEADKKSWGVKLSRKDADAPGDSSAATPDPEVT